MKPSTYKTSFDIYLPATKDREPMFLESVEVDAYRNFGEEFLTAESSERIERIKARHLGLLTGKDIEALRKRLDLTQKQLTELLDCGDKSISRWENGRGYPTGIVNRLLRLLDEGILTPANLKAVSGPRSELSTERFVQNRQSNVIHYNFNTIRPEPESPEDELLQTAASS